MTFIKVNGVEYPAEIYGSKIDREWDGRESKTVKILSTTYTEAKRLLSNDSKWSIVQREGDEVNEWDNSDFCLSGPITDWRDGSFSVKMGKLTDLEEAYIALYGGN